MTKYTIPTQNRYQPLCNSIDIFSDFLFTEITVNDFNNLFTISRSPGDGHCLLHSFVCSYNSQVFTNDKLSVENLTNKLRLQSNTDLEKYSISTGVNISALMKLKDEYVNQKKYDSEYGDIVPYIIVDIMKCNIGIIQPKSDTAFQKYVIGENDETIYVLKTNVKL